MDNIKQILKKKSFRPSKKMGQNFLSDINVINKICENIPDLSQFDCIVEIGPGLGAITKNLVKISPHLICVELDKRLFAELKTNFSNYQNIEILNDDFLTFDLDKNLSKFNKVIVIANIPYSITTPIILKCLKCSKIQTLYIMVQKEVADKWSYSKTSNRNATTNIINYYFDISRIMNIKNTSFTPIPKVDSTMIILSKKNKGKYDAKFYEFMKPFFLAKRKKMLNNLPSNINKNKLMEILLEFGYDENIRSEQLTYDEWQKIYQRFK